MKNRGDRLYRKALIKKRLIKEAIRAHNRHWTGLHWNGAYIALIREPGELPQKGWYRLRRVLRNEGKSRERIYKCASFWCEWCIDSLTHKNERWNAAMAADFATWEANDCINDEAEAFWEQQKRWRNSVAEVLSLLASL